jgi:hypothetical protein
VKAWQPVARHSAEGATALAAVRIFTRQKWAKKIACDKVVRSRIPGKADAMHAHQKVSPFLFAGHLRMDAICELQREEPPLIFCVYDAAAGRCRKFRTGWIWTSRRGFQPAQAFGKALGLR